MISFLQFNFIAHVLYIDGDGRFIDKDIERGFNHDVLDQSEAFLSRLLSHLLWNIHFIDFCLGKMISTNVLQTFYDIIDIRFPRFCLVFLLSILILEKANIFFDVKFSEFVNEHSVLRLEMQSAISS